MCAITVLLISQLIMTEELDIGNDFSNKMEIETTMNATA